MSKLKKIQKLKYVYSDVVSLVNNYAKDKKKVLEIGCVTGNNLVFFAENKCDVCGIDLNKRAINYAKRLLKSKKLKASLKIADAARLPYKDKSFDLILDRACLQHNKIYKIKKIIKEVKRVLKPKGVFMLVNVRSKKDGALKNFKKDNQIAAKYKRSTSDESIRYCLQPP